MCKGAASKLPESGDKRGKKMPLFLLGLAILAIGYFTYGKLVEKILAPDDRPTPCQTCDDGEIGRAHV